MTLRDRLERWLERLWEGRAPRGLALVWLPLALAALCTRFASWRRRRHPRRPAPLPVVSVGNLRVGGSGKTQIVMELCRRAAVAGLAPAVVLRGHGGRERGPALLSNGDADRFGDEAVLLERRLARTAVIVARDRWAGVELARSAGCSWVVLDDGLQQRAVEPSHDVVVLPAESPWGNGRLLPLGPLRDPRASLSGRELLWLHGEGDGTGVDAPVRSRSRAAGFVPAGDLFAELLAKVPAPAAAFAGIGRPDRFFRTLESAGLALAAAWPLADHRSFTVAELRRAERLAREAGAACLVCTEKDAVRLPRGLDLGLPLFSLRVDLVIERGQGEVEALFR
ncbi:MAG TPA: tetraacyldisaccharide 4'-kinase [Myxococcales bacterium]|nr:tetraacyldisaccharide 4'-kinase [Myxococcales bacterium]